MNTIFGMSILESIGVIAFSFVVIFGIVLWEVLKHEFRNRKKGE